MRSDLAIFALLGFAAAWPFGWRWFIRQRKAAPVPVQTPRAECYVNSCEAGQWVLVGVFLGLAIAFGIVVLGELIR